MNNKTYNGWTNYETWNVKLWMDNSEGDQSYWQEQAERVFEGAEADEYIDRAGRARIDLSDLLKEHFDNAGQDLLELAHAQCSMWADLLGAALSEVNWHEIAEHLLDEVEGYKEAETATKTP